MKTIAVLLLSAVILAAEAAPSRQERQVGGMRGGRRVARLRLLRGICNGDIELPDEMPEFEMPEFEIPEDFEMPDLSSYLPEDFDMESVIAIYQKTLTWRA